MKELCTHVCCNEPISDSYRKELLVLIKVKKHRRSFLNYINKFRVGGNFKLDKVIIENIGLIMYDILDEINIVKDYENAKYCLIISHTYFYLEDNIKIFLQTKIENHILLKNIDFWETYIACILLII
jgi:hypothetical protein